MESVVHHRSHSFPHRARVRIELSFNLQGVKSLLGGEECHLRRKQVQSQQAIELGDLDVATKQLAVDLVMVLGEIHLQL